MFALDRMLSMETGTEKFPLPGKFNAHDYFAGIYGARVYPDMKPETVILKVSARQAKYFRSLPLHQSQEVVEETPEFTLFKYFITPDYDFKQDVLSFGNSVEVLEPQEVRTAIGDMVRKLNDKYNGTDV
jgi:predicted DNA-binding transcriptional regulator YafY